MIASTSLLSFCVSNGFVARGAVGRGSSQAATDKVQATAVSVFHTIRCMTSSRRFSSLARKRIEGGAVQTPLGIDENGSRRRNPTRRITRDRCQVRGRYCVLPYDPRIAHPACHRMLWGSHRRLSMPVIDREHWATLEPLLDEALDLPPEDQRTWLEALRARAPEIARELTSLLSAEAAADQRGFLTEPPEMTLAGLQVGAYALERSLGRGGMGSVWLARRTDGRFEGRAAVKLLNLSLLGAAGQVRFRAEGSMLARLTHPGIARLLDAGVAS